jgi:hypothetical protein
MRFILFLLLNLPLILSAQNNVKGKVIDFKTNKAISDATVYVNGTTIGTTTNLEGEFLLEDIPIPCYIGVSHVEYKPGMIDFTKDNISMLTIKINKRNVQLHQVKITDRNKRYKNVYAFKRDFIGIDYFGSKAKLLDDTPLFFTHKKKTKKVLFPEGMVFQENPRNESKLVYEKGKRYIQYKKNVATEVFANAPLVIDLPYLGYTIQSELVNYISEYDKNRECSFLAYYYFTPYKKHLRKYDRRRKKAYYNSSMHFGRALYHNELKKNGYQLFETIGKGNEKRNIAVDLQTIRTYIKDNTIYIIGLQDKHFTIIYNGKRDGTPIDLNTHQLRSGPQSMIYFSSNTCKIKSNGTVSDNNILFGGSISEKKVGAILPENYFPNK